MGGIVRLIVVVGLALLVAASACGGQSREERIEDAAQRIVSQITGEPSFDCRDLYSSWFGTDSSGDPLLDVPPEDWNDVGLLVEERLRDYCDEEAR